jgi:hypothetical protein
MGGAVFGQGTGSVSFEKEPRNDVSLSLKPKITSVDSLEVWQQQIVLHTDKSLLRPEDYLFFKAYILTGPKQLRVSASEVLKVEILDEGGALLESQYHRIIDGKSEGSIQIPRKIKEGNYYFRAYTRWMLNYGPESFAIKEIEINDDKIQSRLKQKTGSDILIYPEGGQLVHGLTQHVAVSLNNTNKSLLPVLNGHGKVVATIKNYGINLGTFILKPSREENYFIKLEDDRLIQLPKVQELGYSLQVNNLDEDRAYIRIETSPERKDEIIYLKGIANGITYFDIEVDFDTNGIALNDIPKVDLPPGLLELKLEDEHEQVWAIRSINIDKKELRIVMERQTSSEGNDILKLRVTDKNGAPVKTELSISLSRQDNLENDLNLLQEESLRDRTTRNQRFFNDLMVLTGQSIENVQGYNFKSVSEQVNYNFQDGLDFYGQAYNLNNSLLINTKVQMLINTSNDVIVKETETNSDGLFKLSGLQINGKATMVFRTVGEEAKTKLVKVVPYEYEIPPLNSNDEVLKNNKKSKQSKKLFPRRLKMEFNSKAETERMIELDELNLVATRPVQKASPTVYDLKATRVISQNIEKPKTIPQLLLNIPGVQIVGLGTLNPEVFIPRAARIGPLLWVIDGFPLNQSTNLVDIISLLSYTDVERLELFIGSEASIYGSRASGGVIVIYTRSGSEVEYLATRKEAQITYQGFHESINFQTYQEISSKKRKGQTDIATTLYWDPNLPTNEKGEAFIPLSLPANHDRIKIEVNAITVKGQRGSLNTTF